VIEWRLESPARLMHEGFHRRDTAWQSRNPKWGIANLECVSRSCRFCMPQAAREHTKAAAAAAALQNVAVFDVQLDDLR